MDKKKSPEIDPVDVGAAGLNLLENDPDITETIDLSRLFAEEYSPSGSFDLREMKFAAFGKLLQAMSVPTLLISSSRSVDFANDSFLDLARLPFDPTGKEISDLFPRRRECDETMAALEEVFRDRVPRTMERRLLIHDTEVWGRIHLRALRLGGERMILVQIENISAQKELSTTRKYRRLVKILPLGIAEFGTNWPLSSSLPVEQLLDSIVHARVLDGNNEFARLYRCGSIEELMGAPLSKLFPITDSRTAFYRKWIRSGFRPGSFETAEIGPNQRSKYFENTVIGNVADGELHGFWWLVKDVSERKRMEDELLKTHKLDSLGTLAGGIAHDFNNLLTGILGNISLVQEQRDLSTKSHSRLLDAAKAANRAQDLTRQLSTFSKGGAPIKTSASISQLLKDCTGFVLRGTKVRGRFSIPDDLWHVDMDAGQISQVIDNLVINAAQAMPNGGPVLVRASNVVVRREHHLPLDEGRYVRVSIADQGTGIPKEHIRKIFDPYFTTKQTGSGLGLATSYSIIKRHGGLITVRSKVGVGTTFYFFLPASSHQPASSIRTISDEGCIRRRILIMDDEELIRTLGKELLTAHGFDVDVARDGLEALQVYQRAMVSGRPVDLVVMDLTIPGGMGGKETIAEMVRLDPHVKAIVSSGYSNDPIMSDYARYGFKAVLPKPYDGRQMCELIEGLLSPPGAQSE
ncbi:MAG: ATP-binding protein [Desulfomonilaceae bacterium]|nr:ATP-binding protein [Desulfomonilaceae bacterium]